MKIEILKPFGPSIVKLKIPEECIYEMNKLTDSDEERRSVSFNAIFDNEATSF